MYNRFYLYLAAGSIELAFFIFFIRYFLNIPILYSLNDFLWLSSLIFLTAFLLQKFKYYLISLFLLSLLELAILIFEEISQITTTKFFYNYNVTFDPMDLKMYISSFLLTLTFIYCYDFWKFKKIKVHQNK